MGALDDMGGETIRAFRDQYVNRLPDILVNQSGGVADLTHMVLAEKVLWAEVQRSVVSVAEATRTAMEARSPDASAGMLLSVAGIFLGISSAIASGGWSTVLAVTAGLTNVGAQGATLDFGTPKRPALAGNDPMAVLDSVVEALDTLRTDIRAEEQKIQESVTGLAGKLDDPTYNLGLPPGFLSGHTEDVRRRG